MAFFSSHAPLAMNVVLEIPVLSLLDQRRISLQGHTVMESQNGLGRNGTLEVTYFQPPAVDRNIFHEIKLLKCPSNLNLNTSSDGTSATSQGNLFHCLTTLIVNILFRIANLSLPSFSSKLLPLLKSLSIFL